MQNEDARMQTTKGECLMLGSSFIEPDIVNKITLQRHPKDVENDLYAFLTEQNFRSEILFSYNFK
jgi:hypothetical protein